MKIQWNDVISLKATNKPQSSQSPLVVFSLTTQIDHMSDTVTKEEQNKNENYNSGCI